MSLKRRLLRVKMEFPGGREVILDETLYVRAHVQKSALGIQGKAVLDVGGLTTSLREELLSQFTAWNKRMVESGQAPQEWIDISVEAGYSQNGVERLSLVFRGQVVMTEIVAPPPNIIFRIHCYSRQIDKTRHLTSPAPAQTTYYGYVQWAAEQMGFGDRFICETSFNDTVVMNPARSIYVASALLWDIQNMYRPNVAAFVDDDILIVKDRNKIINPSNVADVTEFIGMPAWTEWGVEFTTLFDPNVRLAQASRLTSKMNPSVNNTYVVTDIQYDLSSRDKPFYVSANASPPA